MSVNPRNGIFISYAHEDREWLDRFLVYLKPLVRSGIPIWVDREIKPGDKWYQEIRHAIDQSCLAVLMISADFLASEFIIRDELEMLREARGDKKRGALRILWIALGHADFESEDLKDIVEVQALNDMEHPISTMSSKGEWSRAFVEICRKIKGTLAEHTEVHEQEEPPEKEREGEDEEVEGRKLVPRLRKFAVRTLESELCVMDTAGRLWVREGRQIKLFHVSRDSLLGRETLPDRLWKNHADETWQGQVLLADWSGAIYRFDGQHHTREKPFHEARHDDLPVHRFAIGPQGHLFAASWNGVVRRWEADGNLSTAGWPIYLPVLPLHLAPLGDGGLAVGNQDREIRGYSPSGAEKWRWHADNKICRLWLADEVGNPNVVGTQLGDCRLVNLVDGRPAEEIKFSSPIRFLARRPSRSGGSWGIVACEGGRIDWLSMTGLARLDGVDVDFPVKQLAVVPNLQDDARLIATGLTEDGRLFTLDEVNLTCYEQPREIRRLFVDPTGRFLYLLFEQKIEVYANPLARAIACRVDVDGPVEGKLKLNTSRKLVVRLKNTGPIPICQVQGEFVASDSVQSHMAPRASTAPIQPDECIDLEFLVCAKVAGDLPLQLRVTLLDEGGTATTLDKNLIAQSED